MLSSLPEFIFENETEIDFTETDSILESTEEFEINEDSWDDLRDGLKDSYEETGIPNVTRFIGDTFKRFGKVFLLLFISLVAIYLLTRKLYQVLRKKYLIKKLIRKETDPKKKELLKKQLEQLSNQELEIMDKLAKEKEKKKALKEKMGPSEIKKAKETPKYDKIDKKIKQTESAIQKLKEDDKIDREKIKKEN